MPRPLRVYLPGLTSGECFLPEEAVRYVVRVHRLGRGDPLLVFDPESGTEAEAELTAVGARPQCRVGELRPGTRRGLAGLRLCLARPKAAALEEVVRASVALGVGELALLDTERSVPRSDAWSGRQRSRLRAIALDTARQSLRSDLPALVDPMPLARAVAEAERRNPGLAGHCVLHPGAGERRLGSMAEEAWSRLRASAECCLWVGPEGGFSPTEVRLLVARGAMPARLGPLVLRVATAVTAALGLLVAGVVAPGDPEEWAEEGLAAKLRG